MHQFYKPLAYRRIEDITQALWAARVSPGTVSELSKKIYGRFEVWRNRKIENSYPYIYLDGLCLERNWGGGSFQHTRLLCGLVALTKYKAYIMAERVQTNGAISSTSPKPHSPQCLVVALPSRQK